MYRALPILPWVVATSGRERAPRNERKIISTRHVLCEQTFCAIANEIKPQLKCRLDFDLYSFGGELTV